METLSDIGRAEAKVLADIREFLNALRSLSDDTDSLDEGIYRLRQIRNTLGLYENLNQIQHEHLILQGLRWLQEHAYGGETLECFHRC